MRPSRNPSTEPWNDAQFGDSALDVPGSFLTHELKERLETGHVAPFVARALQALQRKYRQSISNGVFADPVFAEECERRKERYLVTCGLEFSPECIALMEEGEQWPSPPNATPEARIRSFQETLHQHSGVIAKFWGPKNGKNDLMGITVLWHASIAAVPEILQLAHINDGHRYIDSKRIANEMGDALSMTASLLGIGKEAGEMTVQKMRRFHVIDAEGSSRKDDPGTEHDRLVQGHDINSSLISIPSAAMSFSFIEMTRAALFMAEKRGITATAEEEQAMWDIAQAIAHCSGFRFPPTAQRRVNFLNNVDVLARVDVSEKSLQHSTTALRTVVRFLESPKKRSAQSPALDRNSNSTGGLTRADIVEFFASQPCSQKRVKAALGMDGD